MGDERDEQEDTNVTTFSVEYDGERLRDGRMDIRDLAPALLSVARLCEEANRELNGQRARIAVQVNANFKRGSFGVSLDVVQTVVENAKNMLLSTPVHEAKEILDTLGLLHTVATVASGGTLGLIQLVRVIARRVPKAIVHEPAAVKIVIENQTIVVSPEVWRLYIDPEVQKSIETVVAPLRKDGVEVVKFIADGVVQERVEKDEREYFEAIGANVPASFEDEADTIRIWQVRSLSFDPELLWRFWEGDSEVSARIVDPMFWKLVDAHEINFKKDDLLRVRVRTHTVLAEGQIKPRVERQVIEVIEKIGEPIPFPFGGPPK
ncbi:MAG: hypothetical protein JWN27_2880 [Candidatus Eremiobacteraeota bacterium]|nr:hypothetical protein [Candidatus Eremiobacteraeota bacterium]